MPPRRKHRLAQLDRAHMRWRLQRMTDQEMRSLLRNERKTRWREETSTDEHELRRRTKNVLRS